MIDWTPERTKRLLDLYEQSVSLATMADRLGTTRRSVETKLRKLRQQGRAIPDGNERRSRVMWTVAQDQVLLGNPTLPEGELAAMVNAVHGMPRTHTAVHDRMRRLGLNGKGSVLLPPTTRTRNYDGSRGWPRVDPCPYQQDRNFRAALVDAVRRGERP